MNIIKSFKIFENANSDKPRYFIRWTSSPMDDLKRGFSGHLQAWFNSKEEAFNDYEYHKSRGNFIPYEPKMDPVTGMWNSEPEWGLSGWSFGDKSEFDSAMSEIREISWYHGDSMNQDLYIFLSDDYLLGDGFDGEDVFRNPKKWWHFDLESNWDDFIEVIKT